MLHGLPCIPSHGQRSPRALGATTAWHWLHSLARSPSSATTHRRSSSSSNQDFLSVFCGSITPNYVDRFTSTNYKSRRRMQQSLGTKCLNRRVSWIDEYLLKFVLLAWNFSRVDWWNRLMENGDEVVVSSI